MFKVSNGLCPSYVSEMFKVNSNLYNDLRSLGLKFQLPEAITNYLRIFLLSRLLNFGIPSFLVGLKEELTSVKKNLKLRSGRTYYLNKHFKFSSFLVYMVGDFFLV